MVAWPRRSVGEWTLPCRNKPTGVGIIGQRWRMAPGAAVLTVASITALGIGIKLMAGIDFFTDASWVTIELCWKRRVRGMLLIGVAIARREIDKGYHSG